MASKGNWENIVDILICEFTQNQYENGEKMPSENQLAVRFGVTRPEIRKAYERLKEMGYIYSMQGYGSFFSGKKEKIHLTMNDCLSFTEKMNCLGLHFETENIGLQLVKDNPLIRNMLNVSPSIPIYKLTLLRLLEQEPAAIHISYLRGDLFSNIKNEGGQITSLYDYIRSHGYRNFQSDNLELSVSVPTKKERTLLAIKGYAQSLVVSSKCIDTEAGLTLEVARTIYRSDRFIFQIT